MFRIVEIALCSLPARFHASRFILLPAKKTVIVMSRINYFNVKYVRRRSQTITHLENPDHDLVTHYITFIGLRRHEKDNPLYVMELFIVPCLYCLYT